MKQKQCEHEYVFLDKIAANDGISFQYLFYCKKCMESKVLAYGVAANKKQGK